MGVRADGTKELIAMADGLRESDRVLGGPAARLPPARHARPRYSSVGDGAMGLWRALAEVFPRGPAPEVLGSQNRQRHRTRCRSRPSPARRRPCRRSTTPRTASTPRRRSPRSSKPYGAKWPKAVKKITDDVDELLAFYDFPAEHWIHLRTTNPIESTFATVRLRTKVTRGAGSPAAALAMVFKLVESAQARWRAVNAPHLVALVRAGARFERGHLVERPEAVVA